MKKYVFAAIGFLALAIGFVDWLAGALVPHSWLIVGVGVVAWAAAWFSHSQEKARNPKILPLPAALVIAIFGNADTCAAETAHKWVLTPPEKWSMLQWNPNAVSGPEAWRIVLIILIVCLVYALTYYLLRGCFPQSQK